jgi:DNA-binding transcriptional ArsR family regulator
MKDPTARHALALDAMGNPVRREILRVLRDREQPVGELAKKLPVSRPAVSRHLRLLERAGLVSRVARGNRHYCKLEPTGFEAARDWLDDFWDSALTRFKLVAENSKPKRKRG